MVFVPTENNKSDPFTKGVAREVYEILSGAYVARPNYWILSGKCVRVLMTALGTEDIHTTDGRL